MTEHIQIKSIPPRIQYIADGILNTFEFPFAIFKPENMRVYYNDILQESDSYTVSFNPQTGSGTVTFTRTPEKGCIITLFRSLDIERTTDFQEGGALRATALNHELDYQIACQQQIADNLNRSMVLPPYASNTNVNLTLPIPSAGKAIVWNSDGTNLENSAVKINELESTLRSYKETSEFAASTATENANIAIQKADIATSKADVATEKAQITTQKAEEISSALVTKSNIDMNNLSSAGKKVVCGLSMPSNNYIDLSLGTSDSEYTAPANGYYYICKSASSKQFIDIRNLTANYRKSSLSSNDNQCLIIMPVQKNDVIKITYTAAGALEAFRFIYAQGEI